MKLRVLTIKLRKLHMSLSRSKTLLRRCSGCKKLSTTVYYFKPQKAEVVLISIAKVKEE